MIFHIKKNIQVCLDVEKNHIHFGKLGKRMTVFQGEGAATPKFLKSFMLKEILLPGPTE